MALHDILLLLGAGLLGGIASAMIGGASFFTFPALIACGIAPLIANASNSAALTPGSFLAAFADWQARPRWRGLAGAFALVALLGGGLGALLLIVTPEAAFKKAVPVLIGVSTILFFYSDAIKRWIIGHRRDNPGRHGLTDTGSILAVLLISIYGGYFGLGLGILLLAALSATMEGDFRTINALKNLLGGLVSTVAVALFIAMGMIAWLPTLVLIAGASSGCVIGALAVRVVPAQVMRSLVLIVGPLTTLWYAWRYWFAG